MEPRSVYSRHMAVCVAIVGVGLMGASFGLAAKARGIADHILGFDQSASHLQTAIRLGAVDSEADLATIRQSARLTVIAVPVDSIAAIANQLDGAEGIVTDLGSTKRSIVEQVESTCSRLPYCGSHPMAGSEVKGPTGARADLFEGRAAILTPTNRTNPHVVTQLREIWTRLGSRVVTMSPAAHDEAVAAVSHLPHAIAACLAGCTDHHLLPVSAGGWRDTTRVAAAGAGIWTPIFRANRSALLDSISVFESHLDRLKALLADDDGPGITAWLEDAKRVRDALGR